MNGLVIDNFAGGGGASAGIEAAIGRPIDIAINHDPEAILMHKANHPDTRHYCQDVWEVDPVEATGGQPVALAWFSPDCKHFSKAKGGKPREAKIRDLAWVVHRWIEKLGPERQPRVIMLENVEEFRKWGPLLKTGKPCKRRRGQTFDQWVQQLRDAGYIVEWRELKACDYGAPTSRNRLFLIARCDGLPIIWPDPSHGPGTGQDWRTAADIIDWSIPCPSIFDRKRPLKETTMRRIAAGLKKFVLDAPRPFIVPITHTKSKGEPLNTDNPLRTITTAKGGEFALATPYLTPLTHHGSADRVYGPESPLPTVTAANRGEMALVSPILDRQFGQSKGASLEKPIGSVMPAGQGKTALVAANLLKFQKGQDGKTIEAPVDVVLTRDKIGLVTAFLAQHNGGPRNKNIKGHAATAPLSTITGRGTQQQVVTSNLVKLQNNQDGKPVDEPLDTILAGGFHFAEVRAFLIKYYGHEIGGHDLGKPIGSVTTRDRFRLITVAIDDIEYAIADIGMRMLAPHELYAAQGFPPDYKIAIDGPKGKPMTKTALVRMCGNSVCPPLPEALVRANLPELCEKERKAA